MESALQEPGAPEISHLIPGVPPPAALYISPNEQLVVDSWAYMGQQPLFIKLRMLRPGGYVDTSYYEHQPNADRSRATSYHHLAEGHLLTAMVLATGLTYHRGQCFVNVGLQRGKGAVGVYHHQLIAGYVTNCSALVWPWAQIQSSVEGPGLIRSVAGADPAAGAEFSVTVPAGARWRLITLVATLLTDATVASRVPSLLLDDGATMFYRLKVETAQTASQNIMYNFGAGLSRTTTANWSSLNPVPTNAALMAGYRMLSLTDFLAAGDNWGAPQLLVEEWIEP
jgi:hypothetical protein